MGESSFTELVFVAVSQLSSVGVNQVHRVNDYSHRFREQKGLRGGAVGLR